MEELSEKVEYPSSLSDEESRDLQEQGMNSETSEESDSGVFYFESDHLAMKENKDYHEVLKTIVILESQREHAMKAIQKIIELSQESQENPTRIIEKLKSGGTLEVPDRQVIPEIPVIDWSRYNLPEPPKPPRTQRGKPINDLDASVSSIVKVENGTDKQEKRNQVLVRGRAFDDSKPETFNQLWTSEEQRRLEELLIEYPPEEVEFRRWKKIADALGNRTAKQVQSRVQKYFIKLHKAGLPIPGRCPRLQNENQLRKAFHKHQRNNHFLFKPSTFFPSFDVPMTLSDSDEEVSYSKNVFGIRGDQTFDKDEQEEVEDEKETSKISEEIKNSVEYRKLEILKKVKKEMEKTDGESKFEHVGFQCDFCKEEPIKGTRWHCDECMSRGESVDYCSDCVVTLMEEPNNPFSTINPKSFVIKNLHPLRHTLRPIRGRLGKTTTGVLDPDYLPESFYGGYNYLDPNFMPE